MVNMISLRDAFIYLYRNYGKETAKEFLEYYLKRRVFCKIFFPKLSTSFFEKKYKSYRDLLNKGVSSIYLDIAKSKRLFDEVLQNE